MELVFSTSQVHPRDGFDYWHDVACKNVVEHELWPECRNSFEAEIETGRSGIFELILFANSPMKVAHTQRHVINARSDDLFVCRQMGQPRHRTRGAYGSAKCGGSDAARSLSVRSHVRTRFRLLVLKLPRREVEARVGKTRDMVARAIKPIRAEDHLSSSVSAMLPSLKGKLSGSSVEMFGTHVLDLLAVSLAINTRGTRPRVSCSKALVFSNIRAVVDARLSDPKLNAQTVADAVGVSVRYANEILSEHDTSLRRLILTRRLTRCHARLRIQTKRIGA